jgi:hypothetical protein
MNKIYPFCTSNLGTNLLSDSEYQSDPQRLIGNQPNEAARDVLVNKALRQSSVLVAGIAQFLVNSLNVDITDALTPADIASYLALACRRAAVPPGIGFYYYGDVAGLPFGALVQDGSAVSRVTYAALFAVVGTRFGAGDGSTTFNLPDARGLFVRALDLGRGIDIGRVLGSYQADQVGSHTHQTPLNINFGGSGFPAFETGAPEQKQNYESLPNLPAGSETRPKNTSAILCISI